MADEVRGRVGDDAAAVEHAATYERFMGFLKWGVVAIAILLILMALFLVR